MKQFVFGCVKAVMLAAVFASVMVGCSEEVEDPTVMRGTADMFGVLKTPDTAPGAPQLIPEGTLTVKSVGYYSDWQLTKKLTGTVSPGKTIFIKVEFSEGMKLVVADDKSARPILYYKIGKELTRFRIAGFGARGEDFVSGDAKPVKTQATYLCKYTVRPEDTSVFVAAIGKWSIDTEGNKLPAFYTHNEKLQLGATAPTVTSVGYYADWQLQKPLDGSIQPGSTVFVKIVFSEPVQFTPADNETARPILYYRINEGQTRFRIAKHGASGDDFVSGDAKPLGNGTDDYIARYTVPKDATGQFGIAVGKNNTDTDGNTLAAFYTHEEVLQITAPTTPPSREEPLEPEDTMAPTVLSIEYYLDNRRSQEVDARNEFVPDGTDIYAVVRFSEPVTPVITYTTGNSIDERYALSQPRGTHWRGECKPTDANRTSFVCYTTAWEDAFSVTVTAETADLAGNRLAEPVTAPTLEVRPAVVTDPVREKLQIGEDPGEKMTEGPMKDIRPPTVRLVYFRPKNYPVRQDRASVMRRLITDAQEHYADEMQRHGYGNRKTFAIETGDNGLPVVYHIEGQFNERHYQNGQPRGVYKAKDEVLENHPNGRHHIYIFVMDLSRNAFGAPGCAFGGLHYADRERNEALGGYVIIPASGVCSDDIGIVMHELGHAFGLHHDFRQGRHSDLIMAYASQKRLSKEEAEWLSVSVYFNDTPKDNAPGSITLVSDPKPVQGGIKVIFEIEDIDGLHQVQLLRHEVTSYILIDFKKVKGTTATLEFISPLLARPFTDKNNLQMIDVAGGITRLRFRPVD